MEIEETVKEEREPRRSHWPFSCKTSLGQAATSAPIWGTREDVRAAKQKNMALPIRNGMNNGTPEPRTPVMIMVEVSWEDQRGTVQSTRARIENKSSGGACIRLNKKIAVGTRLRIEGQWERFSGEARYIVDRMGAIIW